MQLLMSPDQQRRAQSDIGEAERHDQAQPFEIGTGGSELGTEQEIVDMPAAGPAESGDGQAIQTIRVAKSCATRLA